MSEFKKYVKKPIPIQAKQNDVDFEIDTLEGKMQAKAGDYEIIGVRGERYSCKKYIFEETYEEFIESPTDDKLLEMAWKTRKKAYPWKSGTKVGCAIATKSGKVVTGFNMEGLWMTSIHAEVCAVTKVVEGGEEGVKIAIVAETTHFTPCGACIDWLIQFCDKNSPVIIENKERKRSEYKLIDLCPHYPIQ